MKIPIIHKWENITGTRIFVTGVVPINGTYLYRKLKTFFDLSGSQ